MKAIVPRSPSEFALEKG